ncbi:MAG TPA: glycosyltransferase [Vicinamibacterales bacterium]|nr:glycosyltransferase [Vicinamibacterales bacterium]
MRKRVLIVQRSLAPPGGGNAVAAWMVHALSGRHEVGTLTVGPWSTSDTNAFYGTAIPEDAVAKHTVRTPWRWLSGLRESRLTRLRSAAVYGASRRLASAYDLMITAEYYAVFARPGIQYVQFPALLHPPPERLPLLVNSYFALCEWVMGASWSGAADNVTLANSRWTADRIRRLGELRDPIVLYPPVLDPGVGLPWANRDDTFLCIGRFDSSKRIDLSISIVKGARSRSMPNARLVIVGSPVDPEYTSRIRRMAAAEQWIDVREDISREELNALMRRSRFGIQAMEGEHFGMATAEMTRAGCLVFAHDSGGSPEVLNNERALLWSTEGEAVRKIVNVQDVEALRVRLKAHAKIFSTETFVERFLEIVGG